MRRKDAGRCGRIRDTGRQGRERRPTSAQRKIRREAPASTLHSRIDNIFHPSEKSPLGGRDDGEPAASRDIQWLAIVGAVTMTGVSAGVGVDGLPAGPAGLVTVGLLITASACWAVSLSGRIHDPRIVVPALIGLGLCGAGLEWQETDGGGFVVGYMALAGLALRTPRKTALLSGAPVVVAMATADAHDSASQASTVLAAILGAGFLFVTSAVAAVSREAHRRAETRLAREAAMREAREQMAKLAERSRLAHELHDILAHCLSGLSVRLEGARMLAATTAADARLAEQLADAKQLAQGGMLNAKRALQAMNGDEIAGLAQLPYLISETASTWSMPIAFHVQGTARPLAPEAGLTVYRAVQEALTNAAKYAGRGTSVSVWLTWEAEGLEVTVTDTGGEGTDTAVMSSGFGLTSMAERAAAHGGRLEAGVLDEGFKVRLWLPVESAQLARQP